MTRATLGLVLADAPAPGGWRSLGPVAADAEALGADAVWLTDHLFWHRPAPDPEVGLALVAAATSRCLLGPMVLQLPLRSVATSAKAMAFLDHLAPDRVVVGVGVGEHEAEYVAAGVGDRYRRRGRLLDEGIGALRAAWATGARDRDAEAHADVDADPGARDLDADADAHADAEARAHGGRAALTMAPARQLPIWVGGRSERARRRAATLGDGWLPHLCTPDWFASQLPLLAADARAAGRDPAALVRGTLVALAVDGVEPDVDPAAWLGRLYGLAPRAFARVLLRGSAQHVAAELARFDDAGADHLAVLVAGDHPLDHLAALLTARTA